MLFFKEKKERKSYRFRISNCMNILLKVYENEGLLLFLILFFKEFVICNDVFVINLLLS